MALIARITRLFQADMHAVLDKIEEPQQMLKQSIREMEASTATDEQQIRNWERKQQLLTKKSDQMAETLTELEEKLSFCFKFNKDDLARSLIKQKLETQQAKLLLAEKIVALKEQLTRLTKQLAEHHSQLAGMKQKAEVYLDEDCVNRNNLSNQLVVIIDEDLEIAFLCEKQKWSAS